MDIKIAVGSSAPLYWQIVDQVCKAVAAGSLRPGDPLPSVRALAEQLVINPNTVARAYADLQREGMVESQRGRGLFVAARRAVLAPEERRRRLDVAIDALLHEVRLLGIPPAEVWGALRDKMPERAPTLVAGGQK